MRSMYKIAVLGDKDSVMGFSALGADVVFPADAEGARAALGRLAAEEYAVVFITERLAADISDAIAQYDDRLTPAIIPIPDNSGTLGIGMANVKSRVERAVGSDII